MKLAEVLDQTFSQAAFAEVVGVSEARVSQLVAEGVLQPGGTALEWMQGYCERLRDVAAGRGYGDGGVDLAKERALLARSQREAQELKNRVARGEFAPVGLLADVLGKAAAGVVDRLDQLEGALKRACPDLPEAARTTVMKVIASARNEWVRSASSLASARLDEITQAEEDAEEGLPAALDEEGAGA